MAQITLKRQADAVSSNNDNLNDDEYDVTWGGKRSRFIYNYALQSSDTFSNSDETESVLSIQSKSTIEAVSELDTLSSKSCGSNCDCECQSIYSSDYNEFEVVSSSSSCHNINDSNSSDYSSLVDYMVPKTIVSYNSPLLRTDNDYFPDDTDIQGTHLKTHLPPPACFKMCVQCKKENPNPYFQYCYTCFRYRMDFFESKPKPIIGKRSKLGSLVKDSQDSGLSNSQQSLTNTQSIHCSWMKEITNLKNNENNTVAIVQKTKKLCDICLVNSKNGLFHHGKIGHVYCCYSCANEIQKQSNKCPLCNVKLKCVTKMMNDLNDDEDKNSRCNIDDFNSSNTSTLEKNVISKTTQVYDKTLINSNNGHLANKTGISTVQKIHFLSPAYFKTCVQCSVHNLNPYFQYCYTCFRYRMEFFESTRMPKSIKRLILDLNKKGNDNSEYSNNSIIEMHERSNNLCNICLTMPKNGAFNHGNISHIYCCYKCAKKVQKQSNKCPICNLKLTFVSKII